MTAPIIRPIAREDLAQWLPLWHGYNKFYGRFGPTALPDEVTQMTWSRFFDAYEPVHCIVAEHEGALLGLVHYLLHRSTTSIAPTCYLQDLFTAEEARGKGIGRKLIEAVYEQAKLLALRAFTGSRTKPTALLCSFTTRSLSAPASSSIAKSSNEVSGLKGKPSAFSRHIHNSALHHICSRVSR